ncbi:hypothetical protein PYCCODRAFT_801178 [Trametes coccinea BRFM310]|uniref:Uncharacterized protein n=1 Tax=Trametes coccinea (strain BRFM310) TaxID=1353009 RepID=A0A1Y2IER6_TRAC3|nr:hypothetical protein PYCCODRAFT_801178 [Trametes coccinea BRFM310]
MPPTLSPAGRLRSRTSDISDLLRGRHDAKTSSDSQQRPPPIPTHLAEPVTPTSKPKGKFSFLGRKRKPSAVSPSSARVANDAVAAKQGQEGEGTLQSSPVLDRVDAPPGMACIRAGQKTLVNVVSRRRGGGATTSLGPGSGRLVMIAFGRTDIPRFHPERIDRAYSHLRQP